RLDADNASGGQRLIAAGKGRRADGGLEPRLPAIGTRGVRRPWAVLRTPWRAAVSPGHNRGNFEWRQPRGVREVAVPPDRGPFRHPASQHFLPDGPRPGARLFVRRERHGPLATRSVAANTAGLNEPRDVRGPRDARSNEVVSVEARQRDRGAGEAEEQSRTAT